MKVSELVSGETYLLDVPIKFKGFTSKPRKKVVYVEQIKGQTVLVKFSEMRWLKNDNESFITIFNNKDKVAVLDEWTDEVSASKLSEIVQAG